MTEKEAIVDWLRWFEKNTTNTIEILIEGVEKDEIKKVDWIAHYLEEDILQDLGKLERGLLREVGKWREEEEDDD